MFHFFELENSPKRQDKSNGAQYSKSSLNILTSTLPRKITLCTSIKRSTLSLAPRIRPCLQCNPVCHGQSLLLPSEKHRIRVLIRHLAEQVPLCLLPKLTVGAVAFPTELNPIEERPSGEVGGRTKFPVENFCQRVLNNGLRRGFNSTLLEHPV